MALTNIGRSGTANWIGSQVKYCIIGTGSGAVNQTRSGLIAPSIIAQYTGSPDMTLNYQSTNTFDYSTLTMSGITLREFGGAAESGTNPRVWNIESTANNAITFDGTSELQIQITWEVP